MERDRWAEWLLKRRFGSDGKDREEAMRILTGVRDRVLANSGLREGSTLLDVGTGDGLIAFGALDIVGPGGKVIFSDVSDDLLAVCREYAREVGVEERCRFLHASAEDLTQVESGSVDAVTTRSVLIFVKDKAKAFQEFFRVLKPGGRFSLFEPINSFMPAREPGTLWGIDVHPIEEIASKVGAVFSAIQGPDDPMVDFNERDLIRLAQEAGFREVHLVYEANIALAGPQDWESSIDRAANPLVPTVREAINQALTESEAARFVAFMKPRFERGGYPRRDAVAYLWAVKE